MRALINNKLKTSFMQNVDVFEKEKFVYEDVILEYEIDKEKVTDEASILWLAKKEFGDNLILLFGESKPLFINPNVQSISNGKGWARLIDVLTQCYPKLKFKYNDRFMNIQLSVRKQK